MRDNVVTTLIHRLKSPAYAVLLGSVILRGLIGVLIIATAPYSTWPMPLRLGIDIFVFFGVVVCGEILFAASLSGLNRFMRQKHDISEEETPIYRGKPEIITQQIAAWNRRQERRLKNLGQEIKIEAIMAFIAFIVSNLYAVNFFVELKVRDQSILDTFNTMIEVSSILTASVVIYYFSARLKEERPDIAEQSEDIVVNGVSQRLTTAAERAKTGEEQETDITLMSLALSKGHPMQRLLPALRKHGDMLLTSADIFDLLAIDDESTQRSVRRALLKAGNAGLHGVYKDSTDNAWRLPAASLHAFIKYAGLIGDKPRAKRGKVAPVILATAAKDADATRAQPGGDRDTDRQIEQVAALPVPDAPLMWSMGYANE